MKKIEKYIANGKYFTSYEDVENYAKANGYRITNTETIRKNVYLISLSSI
jgi:hypothetical protein